MRTIGVLAAAEFVPVQLEQRVTRSKVAFPVQRVTKAQTVATMLMSARKTPTGGSAYMPLLGDKFIFQTYNVNLFTTFQLTPYCCSC